MADKYALLRGFAIWAKEVGDAATPKKTAREVLKGVICGRFKSSVDGDGLTLISTTENGGTATFQIDKDLSRSDVIALAVETGGWLETQPDPDNPPAFPGRIKRLRFSFNKATI
jgi:hypothetical protein